MYNPCLQDTYNYRHTTQFQYQWHNSVFSKWDNSESQAPSPWPLAMGTKNPSVSESRNEIYLIVLVYIVYLFEGFIVYIYI